MSRFERVIFSGPFSELIQSYFWSKFTQFGGIHSEVWEVGRRVHGS